MSSIHPRRNAGRGYAETSPVPVVIVCMLFVLSGVSQLVLAQSAPQSTAPTAAQKAPTPDKNAGKPKASAAETRTVESSDTLEKLNSALESLAARVSPAVVQILVTGYGPLREEDRSQTAFIVRQKAVGSGVIVDPSGYIMTNAHVVEGAQRIRVALPLPMGDSAGQVPIGKRRILEARLVGQHKDTDLALLKIDETDLPTLALLSQRAHVGQLVFAIGSPEGLQNSVTMGVVSALARQPDATKPITYLQTDAPINPGNSGGPLVNADGDLVGINTFILSSSGGNQGLGFAIPAGVLAYAYPQLVKYGHIHQPEAAARRPRIRSGSPVGT